MRSRRIGDQIAAQLQACGSAVMENQREAVDSAAFILKSAIQGELQRAIGSDQQMSNVRKKTSREAAALNLRYDLKGTTNPTALLRATGPWGLVEYNVGPHRIFPRLEGIASRGVKRADRAQMIRQRQLNQAFGARGTYRGKRPMPMPGGRFAYSANHPGTTGKHPFAKGMAKATPRAMAELNTVILRGVAMVWRRGRETRTIFRER